MLSGSVIGDWALPRRLLVLDEIPDTPTSSAALSRLHGDDDRLVPLPGSRVGVEALSGDDLTERIYPGARHEVFLETKRTQVFDDLTAFLDGALAR